MREHIKAGETFVREDVSPEAALERFRGEGQDYKVELIEDLVAANHLDTVSLYTNGPSPTSAAARTRRPPTASRRSSS
jgi:threonyl-tRNA synthetase